MKRAYLYALAALLCLLVITGCTNQEQPGGDTDSVSSESSAAVEDTRPLPTGVKLIREIMALDYQSMTVADFNSKITQMCEAEGTSIFAAMSDSYDHYTTYDDESNFAGIVFADPAMEAFIDTTLSYSSQEIFGEPVLSTSADYMTMKGMTAAEVLDKKREMGTEGWNEYFNNHLEDSELYISLYYTIENIIPDPSAITVAERDEAIDGVRIGMQDAFVELTEEAAQSDSLKESLQEKLDWLAGQYGSDTMQLVCKVDMVQNADGLA
ncbi:MAG: hypothetical protein ACK5LX_03785 [Oscillospiraceae bacterium]